MASENNNPSAAQLAAATVAAAPSNNSPQQQDAQPVSTPQASSNTPVNADSQRCLWEGCTERFSGPEALYEHICDRHIGRKSTNNLNLECHWANCKTKTVKRDHITSHVRVHVPHKPHRCPICNKAFKRPQDLKKHHKTHAEDSGPPNANTNGHGPNGHQGGHPGHNGYGNMGAGPFYPQMQGGVNMNFAGYHAPQGGYYTQAPQNMGAPYSGTVYYNVADGGHGTQATYARHEDGMHALNNLFGAIKQPNFNPTSYAQFSPALVQMHGVVLPPPVSSHAIDYSAPHADGAYAQPLAQLSNIRSKTDLMILEDRLTKMMNTVETQDRNTVSLGPLQNISPSSNHSAQDYPSMHHHAVSTTEQTPALTPGSSAMSYSPGHSPSSDHSSVVSPGVSGIPSYPHLQATAALASAGHTAAAPTLGSQYDPNAQQRRTGGRLTRAAPAADMGAPSTETRPSRPKRERDENIDPALTGPASSSSSGSEHTATPGFESSEEVSGWLRDVRIIEEALQLVRGLLTNSQYSDDSDSPGEGGSGGARSGASDDMEIDKHDVSYPELPSLSK